MQATDRQMARLGWGVKMEVLRAETLLLLEKTREETRRALSQQLPNQAERLDHQRPEQA